MSGSEDEKIVNVIYKKPRPFLAFGQWVDFEQEEPEKDGVIVLYMPDAYSEKYFMMNLSTPCHERWYEDHKKHAKAWFRIPKYRKGRDEEVY